MTRDEWIDMFSREIGVQAPSDDEVESLLALAGVAAHASERTAAPLSCWLAALAGRSPGEALAVAKRLAGD
jgi:hypothetical protein